MPQISQKAKQESAKRVRAQRQRFREKIGEKAPETSKRKADRRTKPEAHVPTGASMGVKVMAVMVGLVPLLLAAFLGARALSGDSRSKEERQRDACISTMQIATEYKMLAEQAEDLARGEELPSRYLEDLKKYVDLKCPSGGQITLGVIGEHVKCSIHGEFSLTSEREDGF